MMKVVYFLKDTRSGEITIGVATTRRLDKRQKQLQSGNPAELKLLGVIPAKKASALQRELYTTFSHAHVRGEWFEPLTELVAYIRSRAVMP